MERTDWLDGGFTSIEAMFLMVTAITHHQFSSPIWGEDEVRKLHAELAEIAADGGPGRGGRERDRGRLTRRAGTAAGSIPAATLASCAAC